MRNAHIRYQCFPSVVCVGNKTEITIVPRDTSRVFREDKEYELTVLGLSEDLTDYYDPLVFDYPCYVADGCLKFTYEFDQEQEYAIRFREKGCPEVKISLYAVEKDLYELRPLKGDFHTHTYYSDGQDGIAMTPSDYREEGFDFFAVTDHNRMYPSKMAAELYEGVPLGMHIMTGEEVHTPGSMLHIVHVGGNRSVCEQYIHEREAYETAIDEMEKSCEQIPETYRRRFAMAKWACTKIHEAGGMAILAHPFWCPRRYNVTEEFAELLFKEKMFDAFELMGGIEARKNNLQLALWQEQCMKGNVLPVVGSSDSHNHDYEKTVFGRRFSVVWAKENTTAAILQAVKDGYSVVGEIPQGNPESVRFYGLKLRLVAFAHFLYENYFSETGKLCVGEGILMRRYAEGEEVGAELAALKDTVENYYQKFYGLTPVPVLKERQKKFLDKALELQRTVGPVTKGSAIFIYNKNERRE